mmetsp:Transcript_16539/g.57822  ORF Transcript_16539/g.57822 Transcript_16539/m.57822 type:complete len:88 (+) Transcript_16539:1-264(+)
MHRRALAMWEELLGPSHVDIAVSLNNLAYTLHAQRRLDEAADRMEAAARMYAETRGDDFHWTVDARRRVASYRQAADAGPPASCVIL